MGDEKLEAFGKIDDETREEFGYPFSCIIDEDPYYMLKDIFRPIIGGLKTLEDCQGFPGTIREVLFKECNNDEDAWLMVCKLENGCYALYNASCDNTGFHCQGGMALYVAESIEVLIKMAATDEERGVLKAAGVY